MDNPKNPRDQNNQAPNRESPNTAQQTQDPRLPQITPISKTPIRNTQQSENHQVPSIASQQTQDPRLPQITPNQQINFPIEPEKPQKPKTFLTKPKVLTSLFLLIFLFITASSLILAYTDYQIYSPPKSVKQFLDGIIVTTPLPKTARIILEEATSKIAAAKTATIETEIAFEASGNFPIKQAKIKIIGPVDFKNNNRVKSEFDITGEVALEGLKLSAGGSVKLIEDKLYLRLNEFPGGSFLNLEKLKDQWYFVKIDEEGQKRSNATETSQKIQKVFENFLARSSTWTTKENSPNDKVYLLKSTPPQHEITALAQELVDALEPVEQTELEKNISREKLDNWLKDLDKIEAAFEINKKTYLLEKWTVEIDAKIENNLPALSGGITNPSVNLTPVKITISSTFTNWDKTIIIEVPENAIDLQDSQDLLKKSLPADLQSQGDLMPLPEEGPAFPQTDPKEQEAPLHDLLLQPSGVLGEKNKYWDLLLLETLDPR